MLSVPCWKMESEGLCLLKKCHRANTGKLRQTSKSSGWWAWMGQWNLGLLYCSWNEGMKFMLGEFNYFQTATSWITSVNHGVTSPWMKYVKTYIWNTHTHTYIYTYFLCIYIYMHTRVLCIYVCVCVWVCVCAHERSLYQRRLVRFETMLLPFLSSSNSSTLPFSFLSVPFLPLTWAGCLGSYSSFIGRFNRFLS